MHGLGVNQTAPNAKQLPMQVIAQLMQSAPQLMGNCSSARMVRLLHRGSMVMVLDCNAGVLLRCVPKAVRARTHVHTMSLPRTFPPYRFPLPQCHTAVNGGAHTPTHVCIYTHVHLCIYRYLYPLTFPSVVLSIPCDDYTVACRGLYEAENGKVPAKSNSQ